MSSSTKRPNILLTTSDQHHWRALGFNNPEVKPPNLGRLATRGMTREPMPMPRIAGA